MKKEFNIGKCFNAGWELYKNNMGILILGYLIVAVLSSLTFGILAAPLMVGYFWIVDRLIKNDPVKPDAGDIFKGFSKFGPAFIAFILFIVVAAVANLIPVLGQIATLLVSPLLMFTLMHIAYDDMEAIDAFKKVFNGLTTGEMLMPVVMGIIAGFVAGAGILVCCVGVFFTAPLAMTLYVYAFKQMKGEDNIIDAEIIDDNEPTPPFVPGEADSDFDDVEPINLKKN